MMPDTEIHADIIRAMRNPPEDGTPGYYSDYNGDTCYESLKIWADRIAAAAERERGTCKNCEYYTRKDCPVDAPAGNAAAMREALEKFLHLARSGLAFVTSYRYTEAENEELEAAFDNARAALAAPQRNCDRYRTWDKAWDAFSKSYFGPTDPGDPEYYFGVWLFAKAEGGVHD